MKYLFTLLLIGTISAQINAQDSQEPTCKVSTKGVYYSKMDSITHLYIRFAEGDSVYTTSSDIDYDLAAKYVVPSNHKFLMVGKYRVNKNRCMVGFKAKNEFGKVKMEGLINDDVISMTVINKADNTSRDFIFSFYPAQ